MRFLQQALFRVRPVFTRRSASAVVLSVGLLCSVFATDRAAADDERPMNASERRHLLMRTGIGAAPGDLMALAGLTREEGVAFIVDNLSTEPVRPMPAWSRLPPPHYHARRDMSTDEKQRFDRDRDRELSELRQWWVHEMLSTDSPQTERLVLFWHDIFATNVQGTDRRILAMALQNQTFRSLGSGTWPQLLKAMIRDSALLDYLDNGSNRAESPSENLARELMELFTLGEGNYQQHDVREAARALTGYGSSEVTGLAFRLRTGMHDKGDKTLFGRGGVKDGDDLIDRILEQPAAARYLTGRFWQAFIADGKPDPAWLDTVSTVFRDADHDLATLYRETLRSAAFWAPEHRGAIVRSPLDLMVGTARSLDYPKHQWQELAGFQAELGLDLFAPPDVAGWREGEAWIASGALLDRRRLLARIISPASTLATSMEQPMVGDAEMSMEMANAAPGNGLLIRVAAEDYRGAAEWRVSLLKEGKPVWEGQPRSLANGHDTERSGRLPPGSDKPWQTVSIDAPLDMLTKADAVAVAYLNDAAGSEGDRNFYVDGVFWQGAWRVASDGRQTGDCPPDDAVSQGALYCAGELVLERPDDAAKHDPDSLAESLPDHRAAAVHVGWSKSEPEKARHSLRLVLDDVQTPAAAFHRLQFAVHAIGDRPLEFRVNSFDCVPDCVPTWPACAWVDEGFTALQTVSIPLDPDSDAPRDPCHVESLPPAYRQLYRTLGKNLPSLLAHVSRLPSAEGREDSLTYFIDRLQRDARSQGASGNFSVFAVDSRFAKAPLAPVIFEPPEVIADSPAVLVQALDAGGLSLFDVLLAGFDDNDLEPLAARDDEAPLESIRRLVEHPAFQVR